MDQNFFMEEINSQKVVWLYRSFPIKQNLVYECVYVWMHKL